MICFAVFCHLFLEGSLRSVGRGGKGIAMTQIWLLSFCEPLSDGCTLQSKWCPVYNGTGFCGFTLSLLCKFQGLSHWCAWILHFPFLLDGCKSFSGQILLRCREWKNGFLFFYCFPCSRAVGDVGWAVQCSSSLVLAQAAPAPARAVCWPRSDLTLFLLGKSCTL